LTVLLNDNLSNWIRTPQQDLCPCLVSITFCIVAWGF
jgi:hypothetical protein